MTVGEQDASADGVALRLENRRLRRELSDRLAELRACRGQASEVSDAVRRRIERDLHDGAQQRLVSVAISLGLLESKLPADPVAAKPIATAARIGLAEALTALRELSQGLYPSVLAERGITAAIDDLCARSLLPTRLESSLDSRPPPEVEAAAYFVASESLTNAAKHAHACEARVTLSREGQLLVLEVGDDGVGGAVPHEGSGLRGLADRAESLGGRLIISSPRGRGTTVRAALPWP